MFLVLLLCVLSSVSAQLQLNEMMYNPSSFQGNDADLEWVEIFNRGNETVNLSTYTIDSKALTGMVNPNGYIVIAKDIEGFSSFYSPVNYTVVEAGISLTNSGDSVTLAGGNFTENVTYSPGWGADGNNKTLERRSDNSWGESLADGGTPGRENSIFNFSSESRQVVISEIFPNPFDEDNQTKPEGEWVELYNQGERSINLRGFSLKDKVGNELSVTSDKVLEHADLILPGKEYLVVYRDNDADFTLNNHGDEDVILFSSEQPIHNLSYSRTVEDMSISQIDGGWYLTLPTPGYDNFLEERCDWVIDIGLENFIFLEDKLDFDVWVIREFGLPQNITVRGEIIDLNGETVQTYSPWTNERVTTQKSQTYSPNLPEGTYEIFFWMEELPCEDADTSDNAVVALAAINPYVYENQSDIVIEKLYLGSDEKVAWGNQFDVKVDLYKGMETQYSIQLWAEKDGEKISKTTKLSIYENYRHYPLTLPLQLIPNCHQQVSDGAAKIVLEAFGLRQEQAFRIEGVDEGICRDYLDYVKEAEKKEEKKEKQKIAHQVAELPASVSAGEVFRLEVQLFNDDNDAHDYQVWSYLYRGSKCYSCSGSAKERDDNRQTVSLKESEVRMLDFLLKADEGMEEGEYKLKVKIRKDEQKTEKELTETIYVQPGNNISGSRQETNASLETLAEGFTGGGAAVAGLPAGEKKPAVVYSGRADYAGMVVYESNTEKARKLIPLFLMITFGLVCAVLAWKKR